MKKILFLTLLTFNLFAQKQKVWLDADTGNEMDDVWAIVRLLWAKEQVDIMGLSSAHFNNADLLTFDKWNQYSTRTINTLKISQELNEEILNTMNLSFINHPMGADRQMGRAWGGYEPRASKASDEILKVIKNLKPNEKLDILSLGAMTNVASLVALDSTVKSKIRIFSMGLRYNFTKKYWDKNEFNGRGDLNAIDFLFNQKNLDWILIPVETCLPYRFEIEEAKSRFDDNNPVEQLMEKRWLETNPQNKNRILWDLALVQAYLLPSEAEFINAQGPIENGQNPVKIYSKINLKAFYDDFWGNVENNRKNFKLPHSKPKLGEVHYGYRIGGLTGQEGKTNELICIEENEQVTQIKVALNQSLNIVKGFQIEVLKKDGSLKSYDFGNTQEGVWQKPFVVKKGAKLIGVSGAAGWFVDNISFQTSDGSSSPIYGGKGGDTDYKLHITKNEKGQYRGRLMGFWGSSTDVLESIGLVFYPVE
jgi:purine nucleosidase